MTVHVHVDLNGVDVLDHITLTRVSNLDFNILPDDTESQYRVRHWGNGFKDSEVFVTHRYGDGRLVLLAKALRALGVDA